MFTGRVSRLAVYKSIAIGYSRRVVTGGFVFVGDDDANVIRCREASEIRHHRLERD